MRRYVGDERAAVGRLMRRAYEGGMTVAQVAVKFDCSYGTAHRLLSEAGTHFRPRGVRAAR